MKLRGWIVADCGMHPEERLCGFSGYYATAFAPLMRDSFRYLDARRIEVEVAGPFKRVIVEEAHEDKSFLLVELPAPTLQGQRRIWVPETALE